MYACLGGMFTEPEVNPKNPFSGAVYFAFFFFLLEKKSLIGLDITEQVMLASHHLPGAWV